MNLREKTGFISSVTLLSLFLALAAIEAKNGNSAGIFLYTFLSWIGYMSAHKIATGKFIDGKNPDKPDTDKNEVMAPGNLIEYAGFLSGASIFIAGMIAGGKGVKTGEILLTFLGGVLFTTGYIIAHWSTTKELL